MTNHDDCPTPEGDWTLDKRAAQERIEQRGLQAQLAGTDAAAKLAERQKAMLGQIEVRFSFLADGTFTWTTKMVMETSAQEALTTGSWEMRGERIAIRLESQEGQTLSGAPERLGRYEGTRLVFEDPLMDLVLERMSS